MKKAINVHQAKTELSRLLARVERGEEVTIARAGKPVAKLVPIRRRGQVVFGRDEGKGWIAPDFNDWTPDLEVDFLGS